MYEAACRQYLTIVTIIIEYIMLMIRNKILCLHHRRASPDKKSIHNNRFPVVLVLAAALLTVNGPVSGQEQMPLSQCIDTALKNNPLIRSATGAAIAADKRILQSSAAYYPQIQGSTGYSENHSLGAFGNSVTKGYSTTLSVNQLLYDFGRTRGAYAAAAAGFQSAENERTRVVQEVVLNVKQAYFSLLQAQKLVMVAQKTLEQGESHLKQAQAFFTAGAKPRFDVTRAEVEVNNAKLGLLNAQNDLRLAMISLNNAMGIDPSTQLVIEDSPVSTATVPTLEDAQKEALTKRPEMAKADADVRAADARVRAAEGGHFPSLSASGSYTWSNGTSDFGSMNGAELKTDLGNSWNAAVTLSVPLFEGGITSGKIGEARANKMVIEAQRDGLKQSILLEVNQAYAGYENAGARILVMESSLKKARENLDIAQGRYQAGVGPYIEVIDAQVAAVKAEMDSLQAYYDLQFSIAKLQKAMGVMMPPY